LRINGKVALVTCVGYVIGRAIALKLASENREGAVANELLPSAGVSVTATVAD
jgi:hypothetical protein